MSHTNQYSISPIAAAVSAALVTPGAALAQDEGASDDALDNIIVTATKREQNLQEIPASIHALPEAMLREIGALNTEDYVRFMPSVNWINFNTGGNNFIVFRGVNTTSSGFTGTQSSSVYLDETPLTATDGTQPDIRMMDIARTEALSGPQGTLFGAAAQAGTLRVITNKPDTSQYEASADVMFRNGSDSDVSHSVTGMINIPLVEDVFAIRIAAQSAEDGGYIDNVLGHTPDTWFGETAAESAAAAPPAYMYPDPYIWRCEQGQGDCVWGTHRLEWGNLRNDDVAEENWNSAEFTALRVQARWEINDNWAVTAAYHYGYTESQGSSAYNPFVGDLQTIGFVKNYSESDWDMSALTIEADLGFAQFVSATSFYENQRTYKIDNTLYYKYYTTNYCGDQGAVGSTAYTWYYWENPVTDRAVYLPLYCVTPAAGSPSGDVTQIPDMAGVGEGPEWQERFTQEFRLSHQGENFDWLAGLYYEDSNDSWNSVWMKDANTPYQESLSYAFLSACSEGTVANYLCYGDYSPNGIDKADPAEVAAALLTADHYWDSRDDTDWETKAVFGEVTWHATDDLDVTVGGRWFDTSNDKLYIKYLAGHTGADGRNYGGFVQPIWQGNDIRQSTSHSEFVPKISVSYTLDDNKMVYGLYTEGYRVGGINRANRRADWDRTLWGQVWDPDKLKNYELGLRSRFANNTVQLNLTGFYMDWEDFQHEVVDPSGGTCIDINDAQIPGDDQTCTSGDSLPWISIVGNVGDAHTTGLTAELDWVPADGWYVGANAQWLEAEIDSTTSDERAGIEPGQKLPNVPEFQGALWATYSWPVNFVPGGEMFVRGQMSYTGETHTLLVPAPLTSGNPSFTNDAYTLADLRFGLISDNGAWEIDVFVNNVTDERAQIQQGSTFAYPWGRSGEYEHAHSVYTVRPREYGMRVIARWGE
jgi:iron complex outermembrane receptor protein